MFSDARRNKSLLRAYRKLGNTEPLGEFLQAAGELTLSEREQIIDQALILIDDLYAHLPLKKARHAVDPVQRLRLLRQRQQDLTEMGFHAEMIHVFKELRDAHTNYGLPSPYAGRVAFLPFLMEEYFDGGERKFLVTRLLFGFEHEAFDRGVEVTYWNGTPVERTVHANADREEGSNAAARFSFGLASMTVRSLGYSLPPGEEWVIVGYRSGATNYEVVFPWRVWNKLEDDAPDLAGGGEPGLARSNDRLRASLNPRVHDLHQTRKRLFAPWATKSDKRMLSICSAMRKCKQPLGELNLSAIDRRRADLETESLLPHVLQFATYTYGGQDYGYCRCRGFDHWPIDDFLNEFLRILQLMPSNGLILDVRGNPGGYVANGEMMLQFLTPYEIEPEPFQFINTALTQAICSPPEDDLPVDIAAWRQDLADTWGASIAQSIETGAVFSKGVPLTDPELANAVGQFYLGPVILITDAQCYSTTDIFAAGFKDHEIGPILGVDDNTGAGGANVWEHETDLVPSLSESNTPIESLPQGTTMRVSIRRSLRVGPHQGQPLEDLGVHPDERHFMTREDIVNSNIDLITHAIEMVQNLSTRQMDIAIEDVDLQNIDVLVTTVGIDRLDFYTDGRPVLSANVADGEELLQVPTNGVLPSQLKVLGFHLSQLVGRRIHFLE